MKKSNVNSWAFNERATEANKIEIEPKAFLKTLYTSCFNFGFDNVSSYGVYKRMAWAYDLRPFLKKILVKQYGSWQEYYAPNKTALRSALHGTIEKMVYIP